MSRPTPGLRRQALLEHRRATRFVGAAVGWRDEPARRRHRPHRRVGGDAGRAPARTRRASADVGARAPIRAAVARCRADDRLLPGPVGVPTHRAVREPTLPGQHAFLLRHRQWQPPRLLRLPRASTSGPAPSARRCITSRSRSSRNAGSTLRPSSRGRRADAPDEWLVAVLLRPRRRAPELISDPLREMYGTTVA